MRAAGPPAGAGPALTAPEIVWLRLSRGVVCIELGPDGKVCLA